MDYTDDAQLSLIIKFLPKVYRIAGHIASRHPILATDDVIQEGVIGLIEAANSFNQTKGASFSTYADYRIRGAIRDAFRRHDFTTQRNLSDNQREDMSGRFKAEKRRQYGDKDRTESDAVLARILYGEVAKLGMRILPARTRQILTWYYRDGWSLKTIGRKIGRSEGRVSQIHAEALATLRRRLNSTPMCND